MDEIVLQAFLFIYMSLNDVIYAEVVSPPETV